MHIVPQVTLILEDVNFAMFASHLNSAEFECTAEFISNTGGYCKSQTANICRVAIISVLQN